MTSYRLKRIYAAPAEDDGYRILVDRIWPRGVSKEKAALDSWCKEIAPSSQLRKWFGHVPERYDEFRRRYQNELQDNPAMTEFRDLVAGKPRVTLLFSAHDETMNQAVVLRDYLSK